MNRNKLSLHLSYLKHDVLGEMNFLIRKISDNIYSSCTTLVSKIRLIKEGVTFGKKLKANGLLHVVRFQKSKIAIGHHCVFNSSYRFNYRGLNHPCIFQTGTTQAVIKIGDYCGFSGVSIVADNEIIIGHHVMVGANTKIGDRDGHPDRLHTTPRPIHIGNNVFIGMHCMVMKGVTIGENTIIGAGSIVTKDIPANCIAAGSPCKVIRMKESR